MRMELPSWPLLFALALALAAGGCRSSTRSVEYPPPPPPPPPAAPAAPTGLSLVETGWGRYDIAWKAPPGVIDGYELHGRVDDAPFEKTHDGLFPASSTSGLLTAFDAPELARIDLRIRAVAGALFSEWSNVASVRQGLQAPVQIDAVPVDAGGGQYLAPLSVRWSLPPGTPAADLLLERAEAWVSNPAWVAIPGVEPGQTTLADGAVEDGRSYQYRLRRLAGGVESAAVTSNPSTALSLLAPAGVSVTLLPAGFRVSWTNRSASADEVVVGRRMSWEPYSTSVGSTAPSGPFDDLEWPQWPGGRYQLHAYRNGFSQSLQTAPAPAPRFALQGPVTLDGSNVVVPTGKTYLQDGAGAVHVLRSALFGAPPAVLRPEGGGWDTHLLVDPVGGLLDAFFALDPEGRPHVSWTPPVDFGAVTAAVRHEWWDGSAWQLSELEVPTRLSAVLFAAGPAGAAHLALVRQSAGPAELLHEEWRDGAWTETALPIPGFVFQATALLAAADGTLLLGLREFSGSRSAVALRPPGGSWTLEEVPGADGLGFDGPWFALGDGGVATVVFERMAGLELRLSSVRRDGAGVWSAPAPVATGPFIGMMLRGALAMKADGSRSLFTFELPDADGMRHHELFVGDASGAWSRMRLGPATVTPLPTFASDGRARILGAAGAMDGGPIELPLFVER